MSLNLATATLDDIEQAHRDCRRMVTRRALVSGAVALAPLPGTDMLADVGMLTRLIPRISERFGLAQSQLDELNPELKIMAFDLVKRLGVTMIGKLVTKELAVSLLSRFGVRVAVKGIVKFVPLAGQAAAVALSVTAMRYVGNAHVEECRRLALRFIESRDNVRACSRD